MNAANNTNESKFEIQLKELGALLDELAMRARRTGAADETEAINNLVRQKRKIEMQFETLKISSQTNTGRAREQIAAEIMKFKTLLEQFATRLKAQAHSQTSG